MNNWNLVETYEDGVIPIDKDYGKLPVTDEFGISYNPDDVVWFHTEDRKVKPALMAKPSLIVTSRPRGRAD